MRNDKKPQKGQGKLSRFADYMKQMHGMQDDTGGQPHDTHSHINTTPVNDDKGTGTKKDGALSRFMGYMKKMHGLEDDTAEQPMHHTPLTDDEGSEADSDNISRANNMSGNLALEDTGEKAQDFKGTMKKLFGYLGGYKFRLIAVIIFAVLSTAFAVVGPRVLGFIATEILNGMTSKASGGGINFVAIGKMATLMLALYPISALFSFAMGTVMTGISQGLTYKLRKEVSEKIGRIPMKYFETRTYGEILSRVTNDIDTMSQSLNQCITQVITSAAMLIGIITMMLPL